MQNLNLKQKLMIIVGIIGALLILIFQRGLYSNEEPKSDTSTGNIQETQNQEPSIFSTNPSPLDQAVILPTQTVEITFNSPLENIPEFKHEISPKVDYKIELSSNRKTIKIIPNSAFELGRTYTLLIRPETKFDGKKTLNKEVIYNFRTIEYKGI